jgi:hypothetical protein
MQVIGTVIVSILQLGSAVILGSLPPLA